MIVLYILVGIVLVSIAAIVVLSVLLTPECGVSQADVERIVSRDYSPDQAPEVMSILSEYQADGSEHGALRMRMAVLKLADGNVQELRRYMDMAQGDFRDVLGPAEEPALLESDESLFSWDTLRCLYSDWRQYRKWLKRK